METTKAEPKSQIKNILIRSSFSSEINSDKSKGHPEASYILKYSPKYYKSLTLERPTNRALLSKFKKIKKLKRFTGTFEDKLPQNLWFNLFANTRKEVEEFPELISNFKPGPFFSERLLIQKIKFFPSVKRILLGQGKFYYYTMSDWDDSLPIKELFARYLCGMRLKNLEILIQRYNCDKMEWILERLDKMGGLLSRTENLSIEIRNEDDMKVQKLLQNENVFSFVTHLGLSGKFNMSFAEIPQVCKNLKSLSLSFSTIADNKLEFQKLLSEIRDLPRLESLNFAWPIEIRRFWSHFTPQESLKNLKVRFDVSDLRNEGLFGASLKDLEEHWGDRKEMTGLEFEIYSKDVEDMLFTRFFITAMLKKINKLRSFKCDIWTPLMGDSSVKYEPFLVHEVAHLYESLESFEYVLNDLQYYGYAKLDPKVMKPFKNLKVFKLKGTQVFGENVGEMVNLLQENQGSVLELGSRLQNMMCSPDWVKETIRKIAEIKRLGSSLKVKIDLSFENCHLVILVKELCEIMTLVKARKDLIVYLTLDNEEVYSNFIEKEILGKYSDLNNLVAVAKDQKIKLRFGDMSIRWRKIVVF